MFDASPVPPLRPPDIPLSFWPYRLLSGVISAKKVVIPSARVDHAGRVCRIPRPAPASAVRGGTVLERCQTIVGLDSRLRLVTGPPALAIEKQMRGKVTAFLTPLG